MFDLEAEKAHKAALDLGKIASRNAFLKLAGKGLYNYQSTRLSQTFWGLKFQNPIGLAAGFDKNGEITEIIEALGFGFTEVGSITANPSTGNPRPRAFRLEADESLINRMGLNNDGAQTIIRRLQKKKLGIPLGVNIAKTHDSDIVGDKAIRDYLFSYREAHKVADYITVNISCPNTSKGKTFEDPGALDELLAALNIKEDASVVPTLVKFSVDLDRDQLDTLINICEQHRINGYIACNTSSSREGLHTNPERLKKVGRGGLSGQAIANQCTQVIRWIHEITNGQKPIIGVGGVNSFESALEKIRAGADLLQIYTGLVYEGPGLIKRINKQLDKYLKSQQLDTIHQLIGDRDTIQK